MSDIVIPVGLRHTHRLRIEQGLTVPAVSTAFTGFADMPEVFATAFLVGFVEWTCIEALRGHLSSEQRTVGVHVDLSHSAATPVGMMVTAEVELVSVQDRRLRFKVRCHDASDLISEGQHDRHVVDMGRFQERLARKAALRS